MTDRRIIKLSLYRSSSYGYLAKENNDGMAWFHDPALVYAENAAINEIEKIEAAFSEQ